MNLIVKVFRYEQLLNEINFGKNKSLPVTSPLICTKRLILGEIKRSQRTTTLCVADLQ